jgi:CDP-glucose 4,6-dehydratase
MNRDFWRGKRVFLTGHTGFKGAWLSLWLQSLGAELTGFSLKPATDPSLFDVARVGDGMRSQMGDIRDLDVLCSAMQAARPEIVIHMAAQSLVRRSYTNPVETYATNVMGTVHVLEAVRKTAGVRVVVNVTSDKCYENRERTPGYREDEPMGGHDPYSNSKGCAELVTSAYRRSFFSAGSIDQRGVALASARAGNVIGGGDWAEDRLVPDLMRAFMSKRVVVIRNPSAVRPWQHVLEPLRGYLLLAERLWADAPAYADGWNFGPNDEDAMEVGAIVGRVTALWGDSATWQRDTAAHPHEARTLRLDCSKARTRLGWAPVLSLPTALEWIVAWYRCYQAGNDMKQYSLAQLSEYQERMG